MPAFTVHLLEVLILPAAREKRNKTGEIARQEANWPAKALTWSGESSG